MFYQCQSGTTKFDTVITSYSTIPHSGDNLQHIYKAICHSSYQMVPNPIRIVLGKFCTRPNAML